MSWWGDNKKADKERGARNVAPIKDKTMEIAGKLNPKQILDAPKKIRDRMRKNQCPVCSKAVPQEGQFHKRCARKAEADGKKWYSAGEAARKREQERIKVQRGVKRHACGCNPNNKFHGKNCKYAGMLMPSWGRYDD